MLRYFMEEIKIRNNFSDVTFCYLKIIPVSTRYHQSKIKTIFPLFMIEMMMVMVMGIFFVFYTFTITRPNPLVLSLIWVRSNEKGRTLWKIYGELDEKSN